MPELPEVETISTALNLKISGLQIQSCLSLSPKLRKPLPQSPGQVLNDSLIVSVARRSKYIQIFLNNGKVLVIHLGMTGRIVVQDAKSYQKEKHDHFQINFTNGQILTYNDPRRFGVIEIYELRNWQDYTNTLGAEPLDKDFTPVYLETLLATKKGAIKEFFMAGKEICGIGNIYVAEILFKSHISPLRSCKDISHKEIACLYTNIIEVLQASIKDGGTTISDYRGIDKQTGFFQNLLNVYGRENQPCFICQTPIRRIKKGRSTYFCTQCQK